MTTFGSFISDTTQTTKLIILAGMVQVLDLLSFLLAYGRFGIHGELLPIPAYLYEQGGLPAVIVVKVGMVILAVAAMLILQRQGHDGLTRIGAYSVIYMGLLGTLVNLWTFLL